MRQIENLKMLVGSTRPSQCQRLTIKRPLQQVMLVFRHFLPSEWNGRPVELLVIRCEKVQRKKDYLRDYRLQNSTPQVSVKS